MRILARWAIVVMSLIACSREVKRSSSASEGEPSTVLGAPVQGSATPTGPQVAEPPRPQPNAAASQPPPREPAFAARFAYLRTGIDAFPDFYRRPGLWMVWRVLHLQSGQWDPYRMPSGTPVAHGDVWSESRVASEADLPPRRALLFGPNGSCVATRSEMATVDLYTDASAAAAITYRLSGCGGTDWAPLVATGNGADFEDLRWAPSKTHWVSQPDERAKAAGNPLLRPWLDRIETPQREGVAAVPQLELTAVTQTQPKIVLASYGAVWPAEPDCRSPFTQRTRMALLNSQGPSWVECPRRGPDACADYHLVGALHTQRDPLALLLMDAGFHLVLVATKADDARFSELAGHEWSSGVYHEEGRFERRFVEVCQGDE